MSVAELGKWPVEFFTGLLNRWRKPSLVLCSVPVRRHVDTDTIRIRLQHLGWQTREIPIRRINPQTQERHIGAWKLIAVKGDRSVEAGGTTLDEAMRNIGIMLGVLPQTSLDD